MCRDAGSAGVAVGALALPWALAGLVVLRSRGAHSPPPLAGGADLSPQHSFTLLALDAACAASAAGLLLLLRQQARPRGGARMADAGCPVENGRHPSHADGHADGGPGRSLCQASDAAGEALVSGGHRSWSQDVLPAATHHAARSPAQSSADTAASGAPRTVLAARAAGCPDSSATECPAPGRQPQRRRRRAPWAAALLLGLLGGLVLHAHSLIAAQAARCALQGPSSPMQAPYIFLQLPSATTPTKFPCLVGGGGEGGKEIGVTCCQCHATARRPARLRGGGALAVAANAATSAAAMHAMLAHLPRCFTVGAPPTPRCSRHHVLPCLLCWEAQHCRHRPRILTKSLGD